MARSLPLTACFCRTSDFNCREGRLCPYRRQPLGEDQAPAQFTSIRYSDGSEKVLDSEPVPFDAAVDETPSRVDREAQWGQPSKRIPRDRSMEMLGYWLIVALAVLCYVVYSQVWPVVRGLLA